LAAPTKLWKENCYVNKIINARKGMENASQKAKRKKKRVNRRKGGSEYNLKRGKGGPLSMRSGCETRKNLMSISAEIVPTGIEYKLHKVTEKKVNLFQLSKRGKKRGHGSIPPYVKTKPLTSPGTDDLTRKVLTQREEGGG